ncbi:hypothetical protein [Paenibacillus chungangensis]|uniref:Uncharacterized protein n=1 Tax=Paenibacillus chungangensis TaxID=696535 RepID=A0ABW3HWA0_9BACL
MILESDYRRRAMAQWQHTKQHELEQLRTDMEDTARRWSSLLERIRKTAYYILRFGDRSI